MCRVVSCRVVAVKSLSLVVLLWMFLISLGLLGLNTPIVLWCEWGVSCDFGVSADRFGSRPATSVHSRWRRRWRYHEIKEVTWQLGSLCDLVLLSVLVIGGQFLQSVRDSAVNYESVE